MTTLIIGLLIPLLGTMLGSAFVFFMRDEMSVRLQKTLLGFASGVMVAASVWSLLIPSMEMVEGNGRWADWLPDNRVNVPDYKTCQSVNPATFYSDFIKYGYHVQCAMYREGIRKVFGEEVESFFFVAQEKEPPYISQVYLCDSEITLFGEKAMRLGIEKYIECREKGIWETYSDKVIQMSIAPKPEELPTNYDRGNSICYAPAYVDSLLSKYEV